MGRLSYVCIASLDGFIADEQGEFAWSAPDHEVHAYLNERDRAVVLELYGRRLYDVLQVWQTYGEGPDATTVERDYGRQWRGRDKIVYSRTLADVHTPRTRLEPTFDPKIVRALVDSVDGDVTVGGADLGAQALRAGIVDAVELYVNPIVVGGGTPWLPAGLRADLRLTQEHRFNGGVVHLAYDVQRPDANGDG